MTLQINIIVQFSCKANLMGITDCINHLKLTREHKVHISKTTFLRECGLKVRDFRCDEQE